MKISFVLALFSALLLLGQQAGFCQNNAIVSLQSAGPPAIAGGKTGKILVTFKIEDGYHIQANIVNNEFLIPASLNMNAGKNIVLKDPVYPAGNPYILEGSREVLLTYEKEVVIRLPVAVKNFTKPGTENLTGKFYFQPCTARRCLPPRSIPVSLQVEIIPPGNSMGRGLR